MGGVSFFAVVLFSMDQHGASRHARTHGVVKHPPGIFQVFDISIDGKALDHVRFQGIALEIVGKPLHADNGAVAPVVNVVDHFVGEVIDHPFFPVFLC